QVRRLLQGLVVSQGHDDRVLPTRRGDDELLAVVHHRIEHLGIAGPGLGVTHGAHRTSLYRILYPHLLRRHRRHLTAGGLPPCACAPVLSLRVRPRLKHSWCTEAGKLHLGVPKVPPCGRRGAAPPGTRSPLVLEECRPCPTSTTPRSWCRCTMRLRSSPR